MIRSDYHMHSEFSSDSEAPMEDMIKKAIALQLEEICFTDHMDYNFPNISPDPKNKGTFLDFQFDPNEYIKELTKLQEKYQDKIKIRIGIELGLLPENVSQVKELMGHHTFDFAIGSSHLLYGNDPYLTSFWDKLRLQESMKKDLTQYYSMPESQQAELECKIIRLVLTDYFKSILTNIELFPWFQVYGHLDYIIRYAPGKDSYYQPEEYFDILDEILKKLILQGRGIEINTAGLKKGLSYANPHNSILKRYHDLGGEIITVGADAHAPNQIAYQFDRAREFLLSSGFRYYTTFDHQQPIFHSLL